MAASSTGSKSLKEYLKRYESSDNVEKKKKKKKVKQSDANHAIGVLLVDEDPVWQKPVNLQEESDDSPDEEKPQVDEDIEVRRMKRLEQLRLRRPYNTISEDGSGWVSVDQVHADPQQRRNRQDTPSPKSDSEHVPSAGLNSDLSPLRKRSAKNDSPSPEPQEEPRRLHTDLSPPRQQRQRHYSLSPERVGGMDLSPPRKKKNNVEGPGLVDLSPPRKRRGRNDSSSPRPDVKPTRGHTDLSPPRQPRRRHRNPSPQNDISLPRQAHQTSSYQDDDMLASNLDLSPPRKKRDNVVGPALADLSPPRSRRRSTENVISRASLAPDLSASRKSEKEELSVSAFSKRSQRTGLITGVDIRNEISKTKTDDLSRFQEMDPSTTGQGAEAIYRDKIKGGRISKDEYLKSKQKKEEKPKEIKLEWGKGLVQKREAEARFQELELEKDKPFARTRDDPELDNMLKDRLRWGDPMAHLVKNKHYKPVLPDLGDNEKMKESGFVIPQDTPSHSWIKRGLDAAPNRYGIRPGRHWDGVDRSNGYEQQMFKRTNEKQATEREAYLWSVADM